MDSKFRIILVSLFGLLLFSCSHNPGSTYGTYSSPYILASEFASSLNAVDGTVSTQVVLGTGQTLRSAIPGQEQWFVIWDAKWGEYKAVSLQYVRSIIYWDYFSNNNAVASQFRSYERSDINSGYTLGDPNGRDYESVVYNAFSGYYTGLRTGYLYDDAEESTDVNLQNFVKDQGKFLLQAAKLSYAYKLDISTSMSLVSLGNRVGTMLTRSNEGQLTNDDSKALMDGFKNLTGVSELTSLMNPAVKKAAIATAASKLHTDAKTAEDVILNGIFKVSL